eukprot:1143173-Rhodomonas_salina.2
MLTGGPSTRSLRKFERRLGSAMIDVVQPLAPTRAVCCAVVVVAAPGSDVSMIMRRRSVQSVGLGDIGLGSVLTTLDSTKSCVGRIGWNLCHIVEALQWGTGWAGRAGS